MDLSQYGSVYCRNHSKKKGAIEYKVFAYIRLRLHLTDLGSVRQGVHI